MYEVTSLLFLLQLCSAPLLTSATIQKCEANKEICGCDTDKGQVSLQSLAANEPFKVKVTSQNAYFLWKPCEDFTQGGVTASAIQNVIPVSYYDLGVFNSWESQVSSSGDPVFKMTAADTVRQSFFTCKCGDGTDFKFLNEDQQGVYQFELTSGYCCPNYGGGGSSGGLSGGSILLIILLVSVCVYLIGGVAFQVGVRKAQGVEKIPNVAFWAAVPGLIKDGFRFTFSCGDRSKTYNEV